MSTAQEILDFWFGELDPEGFPLRDHSELWLGENPPDQERGDHIEDLVRGAEEILSKFKQRERR